MGLVKVNMEPMRLPVIKPKIGNHLIVFAPFAMYLNHSVDFVAFVYCLFGDSVLGVVEGKTACVGWYGDFFLFGDFYRHFSCL